MTDQEFFDITIAHLRQQQVPAYCDNGAGATSCCYRATRSGQPWTLDTPPGETLKCAVGVHIPDNVIAAHMYANSDLFDMLFDRDFGREFEAIFEGVDFTLICDLQRLHDNAAPSVVDSLPRVRTYTEFSGDDFEAACNSIAHNHKLAFEPRA